MNIGRGESADPPVGEVSLASASPVEAGPSADAAPAASLLRSRGVQEAEGQAKRRGRGEV